MKTKELLLHEVPSSLDVTAEIDTSKKIQTQDFQKIGDRYRYIYLKTDLVVWTPYKYFIR